MILHLKKKNRLGKKLNSNPWQRCLLYHPMCVVTNFDFIISKCHVKINIPSLWGQDGGGRDRETKKTRTWIEMSDSLESLKVSLLMSASNVYVSALFHVFNISVPSTIQILHFSEDSQNDSWKRTASWWPSQRAPNWKRQKVWLNGKLGL